MEFFQCNDLHIDKILAKYPDLENGIDVLFIDSYHEPNHVRKLLSKWYFYINKDGYIFLMIHKVIYIELKNIGFYQ